MNDHDRKYDAALAELEATGIWPSNYNPPLNRVLRGMGVNVRPPHYAPFWKIVLCFAAWFAPVWGVLMWFSAWRSDGFTVPAALGAAGFAGALFGIAMGIYYARGRRKHGLSRWADL